MKALTLTHKEGTREALLALAKQVPGAWIGIKIAALLLVLEGQRRGWINALFGLSRMTLERWIHEVNQAGNQALIPKPRTGRPVRLTPSVKRQLEQDLKKNPRQLGLPRSAWDGPTLVAYLEEHFGVILKVRQAQNWMHKLGYSLKRASYVYVQARKKDAHNFRKELKKTAKP